jgi:hypothetical protein
MTTKPLPPATASKAFPLAEVEARLQRELEKAAAESAVLRGNWEPPLDSLRMVSVLLKLEDLFDFALRPEKIVRKGGYTSVEGGVDDMRIGLYRLWQEHRTTKETS